MTLRTPDPDPDPSGGGHGRDKRQHPPLKDCEPERTGAIQLMRASNVELLVDLATGDLSCRRTVPARECYGVALPAQVTEWGLYTGGVAAPREVGK